MADLDALKAICDKHNLILLEDACQSFGASYKGKALGTIGHAGAFSFDFVKTITCAEGGAIVTKDKEVYLKSDAYADHGHDHLGVDRGADLHPYIGYNYRISELHAAVGLAQVRKLDTFLGINRKTKKAFKDALATVPQVTFRRLPDPDGDSATFLAFFLPEEAQARAAAAAMKAAGLPTFYWYDNNWHYIRNWDHFKQSSVMSRMAPGLQQAMELYKVKQFPVSDALMSRCICTPINMSWNDAEVAERAEKLVKAVKSAL
jgi:8-amino-3,8-dideoxy-alpha-D-manno-octulosonate transaminase